jgi:hypothetical protein
MIYLKRRYLLAKTLFHYIYTSDLRLLLRYCATNQKVAGSIPDGVMEFFIEINVSDRAMALGSTQLPTEMSTGSISWG